MLTITSAKRSNEIIIRAIDQSSSVPIVAIDEMNRDIDTIKKWFYRFGLNVNTSKCQAIVMGNSRMSLTGWILDLSHLSLYQLQEL